MFRFTLRRKLLFFSIALAMIPLGVAGRTLIRITQDELKSSANDQLSNTAVEIANEVDFRYRNTWLAPLLIIKNGVDSENLGVEEKVSLLTEGLGDLDRVVALQLSVDGVATPILVTKDQFRRRLEEAGVDPAQALRTEIPNVAEIWQAGESQTLDLVHVDATGDWLLTLLLPLKNPLAGRPAVLSARLNLDSLQDFIEDHPFNRTGTLFLVDSNGRQVLASEPEDLSGLPVVSKALQFLNSSSRAISVESYQSREGEAILGAFSFPGVLNWAVIVQKKEADAYLAISRMINSLLLWVLIGLGIAVMGGILFSLTISRPVLEIGRVAEKVREGDLAVRVTGVKTRDEIGELAERFNEMIQKLYERFHMKKFVSHNTLNAIQLSREGVKLGGERKEVTVLFSDIRGFTAFSEQVEPEVVIEMLNTYLRHQARLVNEYGGDIDKYVGDQLVAVFQGEDMVSSAVKCAALIQHEMDSIREEHSHWGRLSVGIGIHSGEVVMGAMGSEERMDYTIIGDTVNLGARLCSHAKEDQTLISAVSAVELTEEQRRWLVPMEPIRVKGKEKPIEIYQVRIGS